MKNDVIALTRRSLIAAAAALVVAVPAFAQSEAGLKQYFEGRRVTLRIDMPGTQEGVDVHPDARQPMHLDDYRNDLKRYGIAIRAGDSVVVTLVKQKKDLIEFQLGGGGFGTFGDDTSTTVYMPLRERSERERELERRIRDENDRDRRRSMERELEDLRDRRERENRRIIDEKERLEAIKRERLAENRLHGGSRFNLRYDPVVPPGIRPEEVMAALADYVDFGSAGAQPTEPPPPSGDITDIRKGMMREDAERAFGRPVSTSDRREGGVLVTTLVFEVRDHRVSADFVEGVLVRYTIASK
jgi:hypothetical protein